MDDSEHSHLSKFSVRIESRVVALIILEGTYFMNLKDKYSSFF